MIGLLEDCKNSSLQCGLTMITSVYSFFVMIFACSCIIRMWRSKMNLKFETLPLITTLIQSSLQFIQNMFIEDIRILLSSQFVQAVTFSFVAMSFSLLYFRTNTLKPTQNKGFQRHIIGIFSLYKLIIIGLCAFVLSTLKSGDCENWFGANYYIPLSLSGLSMLASCIFGIGLYNKIRWEHSKILLENEQDSELMVFRNVRQHRQLQKQIRTILLTYFCTVIAQVALNIVRELIIEESMICSSDFLFSTVKHDAEIFLFFFTTIEVTPCLIVPYVFYYLPFVKASNNKKRKDDFIFKFSEDEQTTNDSNSSIKSDQERQASGTSRIDAEEDLEGSGIYVKQGGVISSNFINSARESQDTNNTTINTLKQKNFSNTSTASNPSGGQRDTTVVLYNSDATNTTNTNIMSSHKSQQKEDRVSVEDYVRQKRSTMAGITAMDFGFKKSDYDNNEDDD